MKEIIIATHNNDKKSEMMYALRNLKVKILSLDNFPEIGEIEESGSTLLENSLIKSREVQRITGIPTIADDTGLEVEFLNGAPGVYSARYAGNNVSYQDNVRKLLSDLKGVEQKFRNAKFRTYIGQIDKKDKDKISHRGLALKKMISLLEQNIN